MKYHLTGFTASAALHAGILLVALLLFWQDRSGKVEEAQPVNLSLAQFQAVPPSPAPVQPPSTVPELTPPKLEPKPVVKPKPKPLDKPRPVKKPVEKPQPKAQSRPEKKREPRPQPQPEPVTAAAQPVVAPAQAPAATRPAPPAPAASPAASVTPPPVANKAAENAYRARLQSLIAARKQYPRQAERMEAEGTVVVAFTVMPNGAVTGARVSHSSGNEWLDKAALQAVNAVSGVLPFPPDIHKTQWGFSLSVNFHLE